MAKGITSVTVTKWDSVSPARVNRKTGALYLNKPIWDKLSSDAKAFVYFHEKGHVVLDSTDEMEVDKYAFDEYAKTGRSLKNAVRSLTEVLSGKSSQHLDRANAVLAYAINHDKNFSEMASQRKQARVAKRTERKAARQEKKAVRVERKEERKQLRNDKKSARIERKDLRTQSKAEKRVALAQQGIDSGAAVGAGIGNALGGIGGAVAGIMSGGAITGLGTMADNMMSQPQTTSPAVNDLSAGLNYNVPSGAAGAMAGGSAGGWADEDTSAQMERPGASVSLGVNVNKKNNLPWIIGGIALVVVVLVIVLVKKK
ncbi:hypothetical protein [Phnomibacter sp. MR]|uniref:hypothetical protein n=1 Tax=Phnomibacter sp. MR TaxID=3042318 RepID=UPI003A80F1FD